MRQRRVHLSPGMCKQGSYVLVQNCSNWKMLICCRPGSGLRVDYRILGYVTSIISTLKIEQNFRSYENVVSWDKKEWKGSHLTNLQFIGTSGTKRHSKEFGGSLLILPSLGDLIITGLRTWNFGNSHIEGRGGHW